MRTETQKHLSQMLPAGQFTVKLSTIYLSRKNIYLSLLLLLANKSYCYYYGGYMQISNLIYVLSNYEIIFFPILLFL